MSEEGMALARASQGLALSPLQGQICRGESDRELCCHLVVSMNVPLGDLGCWVPVDMGSQQNGLAWAISGARVSKGVTGVSFLFAPFT